MKKQFIRMNNNDEHLSLGNLFRIIKEISKNKLSAMQSEIFCTLFDLESVNDTTVNNYCVGCRGIGSEFRQIYLNKNKRYLKNENEFADNIIGLLNIVDGVVHSVSSLKIQFINDNDNSLVLARKLYNLAKNDRQVPLEFTEEISDLINNHDIYRCLVKEISYIVLEKKQPLYEDELKKEVIENVLSDTSISSIDLQEYLSLKLREGINFDYSMKKLAENGNAYANFEIGSNEYYGYVTGEPRYDVAYKYLIKAAEANHAGANYMIGNLFVRGLLGNKSNDELKRGYDYLVKSYNLGNIAASNLIGNMYLNGIYPLTCNEKEAIKYYEKAISSDYAYAYNNLGRIYENKKDYKKAFEYFVKAADLGESWACNKVGECYRKGIIAKDMMKAFYYYNRALESNYRVICYYAFYNLAVYFYKNGYGEIGKDMDKYYKYLNLASDNGVLNATVELFTDAINKYLDTKDDSVYSMIIELKNKIESHRDYSSSVGEKIENLIKKIIDKKPINIDMIRDV